MNARSYVGGTNDFSWHEIGKLQYHYLVKRGLEAHHVFLDVACGCLRLGQWLIPLLEKNHYYGIDANKEVVEAGISNELLFQVGRIKHPTFMINSDFDLSKMNNTKFDYAMANSLLTHLTKEDITKCFKGVREQAAPDAQFYFTYFDKADFHRKNRKFPDSNPEESNPHAKFFYDWSELRDIGNDAGWDMKFIGNWRHPRKQFLGLATPRG